MSNHTNTQQVIPSLEDIRQDNDGGAINISGIDYQFHFAAQKCLEMLEEPNKYEFVSSETHEDVVVKLKNGPYQFYQVKQKAHEQWDLSELKTRGVWDNFIKVRNKFGSENTFWFVSDQTARHSTQRGAKREPDLGQMKSLTFRGKVNCFQNERDKDHVYRLIDRLKTDWCIDDLEDVEAFFWSTRILTDHEHEKGLESSNILKLRQLLENRGTNTDSFNSARIYNSITDLLRRRVKPPASASYEEAIELRKVRLKDLEACLVGPFTEPSLGQFLLNDGYDELQKRDLRQKTENLDPGLAEFFIESRNYFAVLYRQQLSYVSYVNQLRIAVWSVCHKHKVLAESEAKPIQTYGKILVGLDRLVERERNKSTPIDVTPEYLHGMLCQLTAECRHDWYPLI